MKWATTTLIFCVTVLVGLGLVMLYSASMNMEVTQKSAVKTAPASLPAVMPGSPAPKPAVTAGPSYLISQLVWLAFGLAGCVVAARIDYRRWKKVSPWLLAVSVILLLMVFAPVIGIGRKGAHRWIGLPGLPHFQPSELARLSLILFLAAYGEWFQRQMSGLRQGLVIPGCVIAVVLGLIFVEPDRGCAILLALVAGTVLIVAGVRLRFLFLPALTLLAGLGISIWHDPMRLRRIMAWIHPEASKEGAGYQAYQAMIALGSGGWGGLGLGNGRQKLGFVPEHHTDFIFSIIGEELGLIATLGVVLLFIALVVCGVYIARRSNDTFGLLLGTGITFMIGLQAFINMGVVTSLLPNKGMPLPFISYGGSNLLLTLIAVGLLISISRFAIEPPKKRRNPFESTPELADADA
ncbi:MAG: putative lipid II flippase FtsW [Verrucomicrobiota bacterium]|jgi:cell division protein FtsW